MLRCLRWLFAACEGTPFCSLIAWLARQTCHGSASGNWKKAFSMWVLICSCHCLHQWSPYITTPFTCICFKDLHENSMLRHPYASNRITIALTPSYLFFIFLISSRILAMEPGVTVWKPIAKRLPPLEALGACQAWVEEVHEQPCCQHYQQHLAARSAWRHGDWYHNGRRRAFFVDKVPETNARWCKEVLACPR